jgi:hypothetical protein
MSNETNQAGGGVPSSDDQLASHADDTACPVLTSGKKIALLPIKPADQQIVISRAGGGPAPPCIAVGERLDFEAALASGQPFPGPLTWQVPTGPSFLLTAEGKPVSNAQKPGSRLSLEGGKPCGAGEHAVIRATAGLAKKADHVLRVVALKLVQGQGEGDLKAIDGGVETEARVITLPTDLAGTIEVRTDPADVLVDCAPSGTMAWVKLLGPTSCDQVRVTCTLTLETAPAHPVTRELDVRVDAPAILARRGGATVPFYTQNFRNGGFACVATSWAMVVAYLGSDLDALPVAPAGADETPAAKFFGYCHAHSASSKAENAQAVSSEQNVGGARIRAGSIKRHGLAPATEDDPDVDVSISIEELRTLIRGRIDRNLPSVARVLYGNGKARQPKDEGGYNHTCVVVGYLADGTLVINNPAQTLPVLGDGTKAPKDPRHWFGDKAPDGGYTLKYVDVFEVDE